MYIKETINSDFLPYTYDYTNPYEMLVKLKNRFAQTDKGRENNLINTWRKVQK